MGTWRCILIFSALRLIITTAQEQQQQEKQRPNIVLLITDDQDVLLGGLDQMRHFNRLLVKEGMTFRHGFVHTPICCPSRSSILSGRYLHNGGAINNSLTGNCYGQEWQDNAEQESFAVYAQQAGYFTAYAGKYLNQYGSFTASTGDNNEGGHIGMINQRVPPGWESWAGLVGNSCYYNYSLIISDDGGNSTRLESHEHEYEMDYLPNVLINRTLAVLDQIAENSQPFLLTLAWPSPHGPFTPAPQYKNRFHHLDAHKTPNYNASAVYNDQKHYMMRLLPAISASRGKSIDTIYRRRLETLLSVDDHVKMIIEKLEQMQVLENTFILYMSDNGFQLGQHRLRGDKRQLYEHDIRIPFIVRGPGIPSNAISNEIVLNIDVAPTITDITTGKVPDNMDGQSLMTLLQPRDRAELAASNMQPSFRRDFLVSYHGEWFRSFTTLDMPNNTYHCVRSLEMQSSETYTRNSIYCRFLDDECFVEYYDMLQDEWQLVNRVHELSADQTMYFEGRLANLRTCRGSNCRSTQTTSDTSHFE